MRECVFARVCMCVCACVTACLRLRAWTLTDNDVSLIVKGQYCNAGKGLMQQLANVGIPVKL